MNLIYTHFLLHVLYSRDIALVATLTVIWTICLPVSKQIKRSQLSLAALQVDDLKEKLAAQEVELKQKNEDADALIEKVGDETQCKSKLPSVVNLRK